MTPKDYDELCITKTLEIMKTTTCIAIMMAALTACDKSGSFNNKNKNMNQKEKIQAYHESNLKAIEQEKINYNYNRDDIFKNNVKYKFNNNTTQLVKYEKEKWYIKIFNNIKNILKKIINR